MMRIAISGATSYLGRKVTPLLVERGAGVVPITRSSTNLALLGRHAEHAFAWSDGTFPRSDVLLIMGTLFSGQTLPGQASQLVEANVLWPVQVAQAFLAQGGRKIVAAGTCWEQIGSPPHPPNSYAASKLAARTLLEALCNEHGAALSWLCLADTFGLDDPRTKIFSLLRGAIQSNQRLAMTDGRQVFDPLAALAAADALATACLMPAERVRGVWGISGDEPSTLRGKVERYCELVRRACPVDWGAKSYRFGEPFEVVWQPAPDWWAGAGSFDASIQAMESQPGGLLHGV